MFVLICLLSFTENNCFEIYMNKRKENKEIVNENVKMEYKDVENV